MKLFEIPMFVASLLGLGVLSGLDAPPAYADFTFGTPTNLGPVINSPMHDAGGAISADGLSVAFNRSSELSGGGSISQAWVARRTTASDPWEDPVLLGSWEDDISAVASLKAICEATGGSFPGVTTADGLEIYFNSMSFTGDLWMMKRETVDADWGPPQNLGSVVNSSRGEIAPNISPDGLTLYFNSYERPGGYGGWDLWVTKRASRSDPWGVPTNLGPAVNSPTGDYNHSVSADGLALFFSSPRPGGLGIDDIYMARRASPSDPWGRAVNLGPTVNSSADDYVPCLSGDGSVLCFASTRPGGYGGADFWQAPIIPIVDFNGDGKVDGKEVLAMAQHWGQSQRLFDIGLPPMGDSIVDANDLTVLAGYIGQEVNDPTLIAHWALDEMEGMTAADSAGDNEALVLGNAAWQPDGKIGGALAFNGKDDFARSGKSVLDPAKGPFSVIAWVKGGTPGRVIVSQASGADWLYLNQYGMLTTDLRSAGRDGKSLTSSAFGLDDQWHRVVLVWDGTNRALHMDGVEVARDTQPSLAACSASLHIGGGKNLGTTTFWSGVIDDIRIYNRAVQP